MADFTLAPLEHELFAEAPRERLGLSDALTYRDSCVVESNACRDGVHVARADLVIAHSKAAEAALMGRLTRAIKRVKVNAIAADVKHAAGKLEAAAQAHDDARERLGAAQRDVEDAATAEYERLLKDKRVGADAIACSRWWAEADGVERCHCLEVAGNTWPEGSEPPHNAENHEGKPWCVACQAWDCGGPHPAVTLEVFLRRFGLEVA